MDKENSIISEDLIQIIPEGFVLLHEVDPSIILHILYATDKNFFDRSITGYLHTNKVICTKEAVSVFKLVNEELKKYGYVLVVYDAYRP